LGQERDLICAKRVVLLLALAWTGALVAAIPAAAATVRIYTDELAGPPLMGLGVQWDPYDSFRLMQSDWNLTFQRLDYMHPGFIRVVEPASDYFQGYDSSHNPTYRWSSPHVVQLRTILDYAKSRGITVVLGDWGNPMLGGDTRIPAEFLQQLHDVYGYTNIKYYNLVNEPNYVSGCDFSCWTSEVKALSREFARRGLNSWIALVGPDNANSWDDTPSAQSIDRTAGLDGDNPIGGDSWVTYTLAAIRGLIGAYDSHRYATMRGLEGGVYEDQMYARREQISNRDSPNRAYFEGEVGLTARQTSPFSAHGARDIRSLAPLVDPSAHPSAGTFVDSQPHIREFGYGVWMGDMAIQAFSGGLAGASAWDLDDAMHSGGQYGTQNLKRWGFWNSYGGQAGYPASDRQLRPWYYPWSVLSRSFPSGSRALLTPSTRVRGLRVAAAKVPSGSGYALSLAVVNDSPSPKSVRLIVPSAKRPLTLARYDYFGGERPIDANGFPGPAAVLRQVRLSAGVHVRLPSRGLVVLTSVGLSSIGLADGARTLVDNLDGWGQVRSRTRGLRLDHRNPAQFNDDRSRAQSVTNRAQYLIYRTGQITSFELKAYFHGTLGIRVLGSRDGRRWVRVPLASTNPAPSVGGHGWYLTELIPAALHTPTNQLKIELMNKRTELSQVIIKRRMR
jgi:hypothetical protein